MFNISVASAGAAGHDSGFALCQVSDREKIGSETFVCVAYV